jgi:hypothetical protein
MADEVGQHFTLIELPPRSSGSFSVVRKAVDRRDGSFVAVQIVTGRADGVSLMGAPVRSSRPRRPVPPQYASSGHCGHAGGYDHKVVYHHLTLAAQPWRPIHHCQWRNASAKIVGSSDQMTQKYADLASQPWERYAARSAPVFHGTALLTEGVPR